MSVPNIPLLRKAVEWAETEALKPEVEREWDQSTWVYPAADRTAAHGGTPCGTAYCIAGYVTHLTVGVVESVATAVHGVAIATHAQAELGLTSDQADELFRGGNDIRDVRRVAEQVAATVGERL